MRFKPKKEWGMWVVFMVLVLAISGCAVKTTNVWGDPKTGLNLTYRMTDSPALKYDIQSEEIQKLEMMGQTMETTSSSAIQVTVQSKGQREGNLLLGFTIDNMTISIQSAMTGDISPDLKGLIGKKFEMVLSPIGKEIELPGADQIKYDLGQAGERTIKSSFKNLFPDLPQTAVKVGDSWPSTEKITEKSGPMTINLVLDSQDKIEGLETVDGMECVKITGPITGTIEGEGQQMGADLVIKGTISGTSTWYFAYKKGILVKVVVNSSSKGEVEVSAQGMTIPMSTESKIEIKLVQ